MSLPRLLVALVIALLPSAAGLFAAPTVDLPTPSREMVYKQAGGHELRVSIFEPAAKGPARPAIVFFFGGGWIKGERSQFFPECKELAGEGMVAISADYRTKNNAGVSPRACVEDARSCLRWVRAHAAQLGIDPHRIAAGGGSAGGHLAASTALTDSFDDPADDLSVSCRPDALVLYNPVIDNGPHGYGYALVKDLYPRFSPAANVTKGWPPTLVMLGTRDEFIPVATIEKFHDEMIAKGNVCEATVYVGAKHGFFNWDGGANPYYFRTMATVKDFLARQGFLPRRQ